MTNFISWEEFERVELVLGTILSVDSFAKAKKPAYILNIDFGRTIGMRKSSAQITALYKPADLVGKQILAVINFPVKQIGDFQSECLVTGFYRNDGAVVLAIPDTPIQNGARLA